MYKFRNLKWAIYTQPTPGLEESIKAEIAEKFAGRYFFTPKKMGAQTSEANVNAGLAAANQIVKFIKTGDKTYQVNK